MATREDRERLIDEVKKFPVLYDTRHEHHRDIDVRDRCWTEIATKLGANSEVLKREWKILRDSLRQSLKKARGGATTKAGVPCKKWRFQARMAFVLPYMTRRSQQALRQDDIKSDADAESGLAGEAGEVGEPGDAGEYQLSGGGGGGGGAGAVGGAAPDALELFFASVCASARRLPRPLQRALKRQVLDALLHAEQRADDADLAPLAPDHARDSKPVLYNDF
ncbi:uncharacterized protein LOC126373931 isoform X2 [Pectinophora gossypiella]|nr:uncharacterized protein LOC126373931 isoform X2 [Pectinophora gossypiella]